VDGIVLAGRWRGPVNKVGTAAAIACLFVGITSPAEAGEPPSEPTVLLECDEVTAIVKITPGLSVTPSNSVFGLTSPKAPQPGSASQCTADPGTPWHGFLSGPETAQIKAKLALGFTDSTKTTANGTTTWCAGGDWTYLPSGKLTLRWDAVDPGGKPWQSSAYVRMVTEPSSDVTYRVAKLSGIVMKGVGLGGSVAADFIGAENYLPKAPKVDLTDPRTALRGASTIVAGATPTGGRLAPGYGGSEELLGNCVLGVGTIDQWVLTTDGMSSAALGAGALGFAFWDLHNSCYDGAQWSTQLWPSDPNWTPSGTPQCELALHSFAVTYADEFANGPYVHDGNLVITI
jgi:hypothetical protein